jgi:cation/acetate symporter
MNSYTLLGLFQLLLIIGGSLAAALFVVNRLFPPMERTHDTRDARRPGGPPPPATAADPWPPPPSGAALVPAALPTASHTPVDYVAPNWLDVYWRANLRLIIPLLLIWLLGFTLSALLAPVLNRFSVLTGFPLGYYIHSQGALIVFVALTVIYAWAMRRLDQRFGLDPTESPQQRTYRRRLITGYSIFGLGFAAMVVVTGALDAALDLPPTMIGWFFLLFTIAVYAVIGLRARTERLDEYYVAGRRVPALLNGLATGSDWMSAASFISMAGALFLLGFEGLAYITGWTGGFVLLVLLLAPYLRKFGQFTIPDFIGARYPGAGTRVLSAVICIVISFTYLTAQVTGIGIIMSRFLGINYLLGVVVGLSAVLLCSFLGGMRAITWTQGVQGIIMVFAYLVPVTWLSLTLTGVPLPQLMYGEALRNVMALEAAQGISSSYIEPFNDWTPLNFIALSLCLMLGTAGMPHILVRFYTVPTVHASRSSVAWALGWICVLYLTAPAYAAFSRWEILQDVVGKPAAELPSWATNWARTGLLSIADDPERGGNGDGILQYDELRIDQDLIVLAMPEIAGLPATVVALVAAGGMAAALSTADGLLMVISSAVTHDIYHRTLNPRATPREQLWLGRAMILGAAIMATLAAIQRLAIIVQLVSWAFSLAAATFFPVLVLGIFWKGATSRGATAGMLSGLVVTVAYMSFTYLFPEHALFGISSTAAGIFGAPVNFLVTWLVSRIGAPPAPAVTRLVDSLRHP